MRKHLPPPHTHSLHHHHHPPEKMGQSEGGRAVSFLTRDDTSISHFLINRFKPVLTGTSGDKCGTSQKSFILFFVPHQRAVSAALARGGSGLAFLVSPRYVNVV